MVTSGIMLAEAGIVDRKNVVQTQSYGIAQRGGFSSAEVILSDGEILYQKIENPDIIIVLSDSVVDRYAEATAPVLYDSSLMKDYSDKGWQGVPFYQTALSLGSVKMANFVAIGAMIEKVPLVTFESMAKTIRKKFPPKIAELNIEAMRRGMEAIRMLEKGE